MKVLLIVIISLLYTPTIFAGKEVKGVLMISSQLNEWCMSQEPMKQQFCQAYLFGIYESTDCKFKISTPSFIDLRTTFVTWVFSMGDKGFVYAQEAALASFNKKYGCK